MTTPTEKDRREFCEAADRVVLRLKRNKKARIKFFADMGLMTRKGNLTQWGKNVVWLLRSGQQKDPFTLSDPD